MTKLYKLLGTRNRKDQELQVEALLKAVQMPTIDVIIRYDHLADRVQVVIVGGNVEFDAVHHILDLARKDVQCDEVQASIITEQTSTEEEVE